MGAVVVVHQEGWRWCNRCEGMFFGVGPTKGRCPAGGPHADLLSGKYRLQLSGLGQPGWRRCRRCEGLFFHGNPNAEGGLSTGRCPVPGPAGGVHDPAFSQHYIIDQNSLFSSSEVPTQPEWRWCRKCEGMFFGGHATKGRCPAGGAHDGFGSGNYNLPHNG